MTLTEQNIMQAMAVFKDIEPRITQISVIVAQLRGDHFTTSDDFSYDIYYDRQEIVGTFTEYNCGEIDNYDYTFPVSYLWTDNFADLERVRIEEEKAERKRREEEKRQAEEQRKKDYKEAMRLKKEQSDIDEYARLKRKFEGKS